MSRQIIRSLVNGVIKKKLENIVLDAIDHPTDLPEDFDEVENTAIENNFEDILWAIGEIDTIIGRTQRRRVFERRRTGINRREKALEDYFVNNPENLNKIEPGLTYAGHQIVTRAGRIDIRVKDKENRGATVELKAEDDSSRKNYQQIKKYYHQNEKERIIFITPSLRGDLVISLKDLYDTKKVKFIDYKFVNGDFIGKEKGPEDFPDVEPINWNIKERKTNGLVRVTSAGRGRQLKSKTEDYIQEPEKTPGTQEPVKTFVIGEEIEKTKEVKEEPRKEAQEIEEKIAEIGRAEWDSYPVYYRALLLITPNLKNPEKYLQPIEIEKEQLRRLEELLYPTEMERVMADYENRKEWFIDPTTWSNEFKNAKYKLFRKPFSNNPKKTEALFRKFANKDISSFVDVENQVSEIVKGTSCAFREIDKEYNKHIEILKQDQIRLSNLIEKITCDSDTVKLELFLMDAMEKISKSKDNKIVGDYIKNMLFLLSHPVEKITNEFTKLKITRSEELSKLDRNLALVYFYFGFESNMILKKGIIYPNHKWEISSQNLAELIKEDNEIYRSILSNFRVKGDWSKFPFYYQVMLLHDIAPGEREDYSEPIEVSQKEMTNLETLLTSSDLEKKLSGYKEEDDLDDFDISGDSVGEKRNVLVAGFNAVKETFEHFNKATNEALRYLFGHVENKSLEGLEHCRRLINDNLIKVDRGTEKESKALKKLRRYLEKEYKESGDEVTLDLIKKYFGLKRQRLLNEFLELKIERVKALEEIDENLAQVYIVYSVNTGEALKAQNKQVLYNEKSFAHEKIKDCIARDTQFYQSILENLVVKEEPKEVVTEVVKPEVVGLEVKLEAQERVEHRKTKIHYGHPVSSVIPNRAYESLGKEKQAIVNEFVKGILNNPEYSNSIRKKYATLARESKWYNKSIDENQLRDFFGNLAINIEEECYKSKGK